VGRVLREPRRLRCCCRFQPIAAAPGNAAAPGSETHVYLLRGVLNIFSLGLDEIAAKLQQQGFNVTVANYLSWRSLADEARGGIQGRAGRKPSFLVGHSSGATALPDMVARLDSLGAPVKLAIALDSRSSATSLSGRVGRYINFYVANGNGEPGRQDQAIARRAGKHRRGENWAWHTSRSTRSEIIQRRVIGAINAAGR